MKQSFSIFALAAALLFSASCNTTKNATAQTEEPVVMEVRNLDTMTVSPESNGVIEYEAEVEIPNERPVYRAAYQRTFDLLHTKLDLSFDWEKEMVIGQATLKLTPLFRPARVLELDAKNFDFKSIKLFNGTALKYTYEGDKQKVYITLDREYQRGEEVELVIDYTAVPAQSGGSAAITSDKGLFFINPRGEEGDKPTQIWTQGETENNSRWFPTIDKPNERCTQEMYVTVDDRFTTLSNGALVSKNKNSDGTRTDYWRQELPHAPYLFMLAIGEFDVVEDEKWNGIPVNYYLEPQWAPYAKDIFPYTREMLTFFSELTGVEYPWQKYSQVAVRDYVSGAMENTTAVIFGEFMHGTDRDLIDIDRNEKIVAHEMFHHWFGDYVTCESWSNLTLNEGFANYSEYLWMEKKHGADAADHHMLLERSGYFGSVANGEPHELIWYDYDDKEQMFDAHSYNKGGAVLHMLRHYLGDEVFFASLEYYLTENQYSPVEVDELRMAFEEISGEDLNWFFNQWFLKAGHPQLSLETSYADGTISLTVEQTQDTENNVPAIFRLPVNVNIYTNGQTAPRTERIVVDQRKQTFTFASDDAPDVVIFDPEHVILATYSYTKTADELAAQFRVAPNLVDRYLVLQRMSNKDDSPVKEATYSAGLQDPFYAVRTLALESMGAPTEAQLPLIRKIAMEDPHSEPRSTAIALLAAMEDTKLKEIATAALDARSYRVVAAGLSALVAADPTAAAAAAAKLEGSDNPDITAALAALYGQSGDLSKLPFFEKQFSSIDGFPAIELFGAYQGLLSSGDASVITEGVEKLQAVATNMGQSPWRRLAATKAINDLMSGMMEGEENAALVTMMKETIKAIKAVETEPQLLQIYQQYGG
ncbi:M1 family aminopeptidase [Lewinella sp. W8]|uniref:M1 family aminopeptidase n=1 Tax=Lewinella sp. W8 TaxID=2528208 RepID=UPI0010683D6A|nr:M1 family aminopeptidase [Lewinella sp. W8]MTB51669.1 alanyl aminopeptidase [Lewinella sp. W8]